ncbi:MULTISPECIES: HTH domain-containing protein [unclassified Butyrivibrio]|uniref:HTH domain-containing protein n=1 Tax=unclassified Butyrivibrio TaxID=2639466 RepID=UPI0003B6E5FF
MPKSTEKAARLLCINEYLRSGKQINLQSLATEFRVSKRTIQRDLDDIKAFYANQIVRDESYKSVYFDNKTNTYRLK